MESAPKVRKIAKTREKVCEIKSMKRQKSKQEPQPQHSRKKRCGRAALKERNRDAAPSKKRAEFSKMVEIFNRVQHLKNHEDCLNLSSQFVGEPSKVPYPLFLVAILMLIRNSSLPHHLSPDKTLKAFSFSFFFLH